MLLTPHINYAGFLKKSSHILEIAALELSSREGMQTLVNIFPHKVSHLAGCPVSVARSKTIFIPSGEATWYEATWYEAAWVCTYRCQMQMFMVSRQRWFMMLLCPLPGWHHQVYSTELNRKNLSYFCSRPFYVVSSCLWIMDWCVCREAVQRFIDFINNHCPSEDIVPVLIAHNGKTFDIPFLAMEFARGGMQIPANWYFMDTLLVARRVINKDDIPSLKLVSMSHIS